MHTSKRRDYAWNTAAGVINAAEAVLMSIIVTRFGKLSDAGVLSIAFALGNVLMTIGIFGVRMFQASDIRRQYSYGMYIKLRFITVGMMTASLATILLATGYEPQKAAAVALIAFIYMVESMESCIWGHYQSYDLLYVGARMFVTRWGAIIISFSVCMIISGDMIKALAVGALAGLAVFVVWVALLRRVRVADAEGSQAGAAVGGDLDGSAGAKSDGSGAGKDLNSGGGSYDPGLKGLIRQVFPLFVAEFCSMFIINIPKFAIDRYLDDSVQACYGFVAMPVFVIGLLNQFIYQPRVVGLTNDHLEGRREEFKRSVRAQIVLVGLITMACVVGAAIIGIPVLSFIYHTDLADYWKELVVLQFGGGFLALSGYLYVILTIIRRQKVILAGYVAALISGIIILFPAVKFAGTMGAAIGYLVLMALLFIYYFVAYVKIINGNTSS